MPASVALPDPAAWPDGGTVAEWFVADGAIVHAGDPVCRFETDFVSFELEAEDDGILRYRSGAGESRPTDGILAVILATGEPLAVLGTPPAAALDSPAPTPATSPPAGGEQRAPTLPFVPGQVHAETLPAHDATVLRFPRSFAHELAGGSALDTEPGNPLTLASVPAHAPSAALTAAPAKASGGVRFIRVTADLEECHKMREQLAKEWDAAGIVPRVDDIVVRALARALQELPALACTGTIALRSFTQEAETFRVLEHAGSRPFRDAVAALAGQSVQDAAPEYDCVVTSFTALGVEDATPRLERGRPLALAIGATRDGVTLAGDRPLLRPVASLLAAYDAALIGDVTAARLIARVRDLIQSPYALLAE